jgi:hypothetical protein
MIIPEEEKPFTALFSNFIQNGIVSWIGIRKKSHAPMQVLEETFAEIGGLVNDRYNKGNADGKR